MPVLTHPVPEMSSVSHQVFIVPESASLLIDSRPPPFYRGVPTYAQLAALQRGDITLARRRIRGLGEPRHFLFLHITEIEGTIEVYGFDIANLMNLRSAEPNGLLKRFLAEPDPRLAIDMLKKELLEPILKASDIAANTLPRICFDEQEFNDTKPDSGPLRASILHGCPFRCFNGQHAWPRSPSSPDLRLEDFLNIFAPFAKELSPETKALFEERVESGADVPCPGCLGYDLAKEDLERELAERKEHEKQGMEPVLRRAKEFRELVTQNDYCSYGPASFGFPLSNYYEQSGCDPVHLQNPSRYLHTPELERRGQAFVLALNRARSQVGYHAMMLVSHLNGAVKEFVLVIEANLLDDTEHIKKIRTEALLTGTVDFWKAAGQTVTNDTCAICKFFLCDASDLVFGLPCCHFFHRYCLESWLQNSIDCPTCQKQLPLVDQSVGEDTLHRTAESDLVVRTAELVVEGEESTTH